MKSTLIQEENMFNCEEYILRCEARCCYDGCYLVDSNEEEKIKKFVKDNKEFFNELPKEIFEDVNWKGLITTGRKTCVKKHKFSEYYHPNHFEHTICVFQDKGCMLQKVAIRLGLHPWSIKPIDCVVFPFWIENNVIVSPIDKDPWYLEGEFPGYFKFHPCIEGKDLKSLVTICRKQLLWAKDKGYELSNEIKEVINVQ